MSVALPKPMRVFVTGAGGRTGQFDLTACTTAGRMSGQRLPSPQTAPVCSHRTSNIQQTQVQTGTVCSKGSCQASTLAKVTRHTSHMPCMYMQASIYVYAKAACFNLLCCYWSIMHWRHLPSFEGLCYRLPNLISLP